MECDKIREIILTDYLDDRLTQEKLRVLNEHIAGCLNCRGLLEQARLARKPLKQAERYAVPKNVWENIKAQILEKELQRKPFRERLGALIRIPKPAFALASSLAVVLLVAAGLRFNAYKKEVTVKDFLKEQIIFYSSLDNGEKGNDQDLDILGTF